MSEAILVPRVDTKLVLHEILSHERKNWSIWRQSQTDYEEMFCTFVSQNENGRLSKQQNGCGKSETCWIMSYFPSDWLQLDAAS